MILGEQNNVKLVKEAHEARLLKNFLAGKLTAYCGIKHEELEIVCKMFGIIEEVDRK